MSTEGAEAKFWLSASNIGRGGGGSRGEGGVTPPPPAVYGRSNTSLLWSLCSRGLAFVARGRSHPPTPPPSGSRGRYGGGGQWTVARTSASPNACWARLRQRPSEAHVTHCPCPCDCAVMSGGVRGGILAFLGFWPIPPTHNIRKIFLGGEMKFITRAGKWISGTQTVLWPQTHPPPPSVV